MPLTTSVIAIACKVIVFDFKELKRTCVFSSAAVFFAFGATHLMITKKSGI